jgi:hypothetical protein
MKPNSVAGTLSATSSDSDTGGINTKAAVRSHMNEAWIPLECTDCENVWEAMPAALPTPDAEFECPYCGARDPLTSFVKTPEGLQILEAFEE